MGGAGRYTCSSFPCGMTEPLRGLTLADELLALIFSSCSKQFSSRCTLSTFANQTNPTTPTMHSDVDTPISAYTTQEYLSIHRRLEESSEVGEAPDSSCGAGSMTV